MKLSSETFFPYSRGERTAEINVNMYTGMCSRAWSTKDGMYSMPIGRTNQMQVYVIKGEGLSVGLPVKNKCK